VAVADVSVQFCQIWSDVIRCDPMRSDVVPCSPMWSDAVISHTAISAKIVRGRRPYYVTHDSRAESLITHETVGGLKSARNDARCFTC